MSAIDLIIARGFGPEVQQLGTIMGDEKNRQQNVNQVRQIGDSRLQSEALDRRLATEDQAYQQQQRQAAQGQQSELEGLLAEMRRIAPALAEMESGVRNYPGLPEYASEIDGKLQQLALRAAGPAGVAELLKRPEPQGPSSGIGKLAADLKAGLITQADYDAAVRKATYVAPQGGVAAPAIPTPPAGYVWRDPANPAAGVNPLPGGPKDPDARPTPQISPKDMAVAKNKMIALNTARQQLADVKAKWQKLKGGAAAGPMGLGKLPTPAGNAFDAAVNAMRDTVTSLTRVPGVGAMSDFETRLAMGKFPDRNNYEEVTEQQIGQLEQLLNSLESGYSEMAGTKPASSGPKAPAEMTDDELLKALNGG